MQTKSENKENTEMRVSLRTFYMTVIFIWLFILRIINVIVTRARCYTETVKLK